MYSAGMLGRASRDRGFGEGHSRAVEFLVLFLAYAGNLCWFRLGVSAPLRNCLVVHKLRVEFLFSWEIGVFRMVRIAKALLISIAKKDGLRIIGIRKLISSI
jgi:hypothetical protein